MEEWRQKGGLESVYGTDLENLGSNEIDRI